MAEMKNQKLLNKALNLLPDLVETKVDAVLIGETLMRSPDKKAALGALNAGIV